VRTSAKNFHISNRMKEGKKKSEKIEKKSRGDRRGEKLK
jgi:hypothetical protein